MAHIDLPQLARKAIAHYLETGTVWSPPPSQFLSRRAGVFVTAFTAQDQLRGCIGTIEPVCDDVALEVARNAVAAIAEDPRFAPVTPAELPSLHFEVSVLAPPEPIAGESDLDPKRYGVVVKAKGDRRRGLLLPDIDGIDTVSDQIAIARRKAGIGKDEAIVLFRFVVEKYAEAP